ncbi:MAG: hypothetical protein KDB95_03970 [Flavobacteriales bacterium]|nr:hypothetical protein [Flavobacteriales bacterium]
MKRLFFNVIAVFLMLAGGTLLVAGIMDGQGPSMLLGAGLAFLAGSIALLMQLGYFSERTGNVLGILFVVSAMVLAYRSYRVHRSANTQVNELRAPERNEHGG